MATEERVKHYFAFWFQLGKWAIARGGKQIFKPARVLCKDAYSPEFEACWEILRSSNSGDCYLEGTNQTVRDLLGPAWEIVCCARCPMPVALRTNGMPPSGCPCDDLNNWPNLEMPMPRSPVDDRTQLQSIRDRLLREPENGKPPEPASDLTAKLPPCKGFWSSFIGTGY